MAETIEKITRSDPPKSDKSNFTVTERIVLRRANFRFLLAILILGIYAFTIYSLMYQPIEMDDKTSTLLVSVIGALTVHLCMGTQNLTPVTTMKKKRKKR